MIYGERKKIMDDIMYYLDTSITWLKNNHIPEAIAHIEKSDLTNLTSSVKTYVDSLLQDLIMTYHMSSGECVEELLPYIKKLSQKFKYSYTSSNSPEIAYYLGQVEMVTILFSTIHQQNLVNNHSKNPTMIELLMKASLSGGCDISDQISDDIFKKNIDELHSNGIVSVKGHQSLRITLSRKGKCYLLKQSRITKSIPIKAYAIVNKKIPESSFPKNNLFYILRGVE